MTSFDLVHIVIVAKKPGLRRVGFLAENDYRGFGTWYTLSSFSALHFHLSLIRSTSRRSVCVSYSFKRCWDRGLRWLLPGNVVQCHSSSVVESNTDVIVEQRSSFWFSLRICGVSCSSAVTSLRRISLSGSSCAYCLLVLFFAHGVELDVVLFNPVVTILGIPRTGLALDVLTMRLAQFSVYAISSSCSSQKLRSVSGHTPLWSLTSQELSRSCSPSLTIIRRHRSSHIYRCRVDLHWWR